MRLQSFFEALLGEPNVRQTFWERFRAKKRPGRHSGPFNKSRRGAERRALRRFKTEAREFEPVDLFPSTEPRLSRKDYWRAIDSGLI